MRGLGGVFGRVGVEGGGAYVKVGWRGSYCEYWDEGIVYLGTLVVSVKFWRAAGGRVSWT